VISSPRRRHQPAGHLIGGLLFAALMALASPASAQDWFTAEACAVPKVAIDPTVLSPDELASLSRRAVDVPNGQGRLWRITTSAGRVSHLWGTLHSSDRAVLDLPKPVRVLIDAATIVAIETDPTPATRAAVAELNRWDGFWKSSDAPWDARTDFDPELLEWITARVANMGYDPFSLGQMTDAGLASLLLADPCEDFAGRVIPFQDNYIVTLAHLAGVEIVGLEPPLPILNDLNRPDMAETARVMVQSYGAYLAPWEGASGRASYIALYLQGRIAEMILWSDDFAAKVHGAEKAARFAAILDAYLLDGRNRRFVANARPLIDAGGAFLAVGSFHLPGEAGLITLLRAAGYQVERLPLPGEVAAAP
jgi:uncharacterized protein